MEGGPHGQGLSRGLQRISDEEGSSSEEDWKRKPCLRPPTFDGSSQLDAFLAQFGVVAAANRWSERECGVQLATCLRGTTINILAGLEPGKRMFERQVAALRLCVQPPKKLFQQEFAARRQDAREYVQELGDALLRLA